MLNNRGKQNLWFHSDYYHRFVLPWRSVGYLGICDYQLPQKKQSPNFWILRDIPPIDIRTPCKLRSGKVTFLVRPALQFIPLLFLRDLWNDIDFTLLKQVQNFISIGENLLQLNWFTQSLESSDPLLVVSRRFVIDTQKLKGYAKSKEIARAARTCAYCDSKLCDRRRIFCNSKCRRAFNRKYRFFVITWRQVRYRTFRRDGWSCVKCGRRAREVDHIIPLSDGGNEFDLGNCQSLCKSCHMQKTIGEIKDRALRRRAEEEFMMLSTAFQRAR